MATHTGPAAAPHMRNAEDLSEAVPLDRLSVRGLEAIRLHDAGRVDEGENHEDDVLGERTPGRAKACGPSEFLPPTLQCLWPGW